MGQCLVQLHCEMNAPAGCSPRSQHTVGRRRWVTLGNREMPSALVATSHLYQMCHGPLSIRRHPVTPQALSAPAVLLSLLRHSCHHRYLSLSPSSWWPVHFFPIPPCLLSNCPDKPASLSAYSHWVPRSLDHTCLSVVQKITYASNFPL